MMNPTMNDEPDLTDLMPKSIGGVRVQSLDDDAERLVTEAIKAHKQRERERPGRERQKREEARFNTLAALSALPLDERLARIEAWIYDYQPTYVPPPTFK